MKGRRNKNSVLIVHRIIDSHSFKVANAKCKQFVITRVCRFPLYRDQTAKCELSIDHVLASCAHNLSCMNFPCAENYSFCSPFRHRNDTAVRDNSNSSNVRQLNEAPDHASAITRMNEKYRSATRTPSMIRHSSAGHDKIIEWKDTSVARRMPPKRLCKSYYCEFVLHH